MKELIFLLFISFYLGKGRLHNFNYGLYWPLWDLICGTRYRDRPNTTNDKQQLNIKEQEQNEDKKLT